MDLRTARVQRIIDLLSLEINSVDWKVYLLNFFSLGIFLTIGKKEFKYEQKISEEFTGFYQYLMKIEPSDYIFV